ILCKAANEAEAKEMLRLLSGRAHKIITAVVVRAPNGKVGHRRTTSRGKVKRLSEKELDNFIATGEWEDCDGEYKFQGNFAQYILNAEGSITGIIGLPLHETSALLRGLGYDF